MILHPLEHWYDVPFPETEAGEHFAIYRTREFRVRWRELATMEHRLLERLSAGASLAQACDHLEQNEPQLIAEASENLQRWCHEWVTLGLLATG